MPQDLHWTLTGVNSKLINRALQLFLIGAAYFVLAKFGLQLASIHPSATPIWPPTGFALAATLLWGYRVWPAILLAAFLANVTTAGTLVTSLAIASGNTIEAMLGAYLINRFSGGLNTFGSPMGVARFALISLAVSTPISATIGVVALKMAGIANGDNLNSIWLTWWLGDLAGAVVFAPVIVLWVDSWRRGTLRADMQESAIVFLAAVAVGLIAFSPLLEQTTNRAALGFLAVLPLLSAALRCGQRDTAMVALILSCFAIWGTVMETGPFWRGSLNDSFLLLIMFMISSVLPSLALSAEVARRKADEERLRRMQADLETRVEQGVAALAHASRSLAEEIEQRQQAEQQLTHGAKKRRETQDALRESERRFRLLIEGVTDYGIFMLDPNGFVSNWNSSAERIKGYADHEIIGQHFSRFYTEEDRKTGLPEKGMAAAAHEGKFESEGWRVRRDGTLFWASVVIDAIRDEQGVLVGFAKITRDITERRNAELALRETQERLVQAQKLEALGQLTGGIAHDFNNLLMIFSGYAQALRRRVSDQRDLQAVDAMLSAASRGERLTRQLLTFSRRQALNPESFDLRKRIDALSEMLRSSLRWNIELVSDIPDDLWPVKVDAAELELALVNATVNARDAIPEKGKVTLAARNVSLTPTPQLDLEGDFVALSISDTGSGMASDVLPRIFEPFFTTKEVGKGTGLGLSQLYGFVRQSGGAVDVKSAPGQGTILTLYLPRGILSSRPAPIETAPPESNHDRSNGKILLVEDNADVAEVARKMLEELGYEVQQANTASVALDRLERGDLPDLVFSDIVMPGGMNGISLADQIAQRFPNMPIVLTSGYSDAARAAQSRYTILRKPYPLEALREVLARALRGGRPVLTA